MKIIERRRLPFHRVPVEISNMIFHAWLLRSIDLGNYSSRDTLVFTHPHEIIEFLSPEIKNKWQSFCLELDLVRSQWKYNGVPTLKRVVRLSRENNFFAHFNLATVVHHFGAVPALVVNEIDGKKVALFYESFAQDEERHKYRDEEVYEILLSLNEFLPFMLRAYYEQIAYYFQSIFFGVSDQNVMGFCLRIRQIIGRSIRSKANLIKQYSKEQYTSNFPRSFMLAQRLKGRYQNLLEEAYAVDNFSHLLVNYIYRFFCIEDRVDEYHDRLQPLPSGRDLFGDDSIALIKRCAQNLLNPEDKFLDELANEKDAREQWLYMLVEMGAFVAEVVRFTKVKKLDIPRIFLTYHFRVKESERFFWLASKTVEKKNLNTELIRGRHLGQNIRWSILARIWFCDHQIIFIPSSWAKVDGMTKKLKTEEDWVVLELLYGRLLRRDLTLIISEPGNSDLVKEFRKHIEQYPESKEIEQVMEEGWIAFIQKAKYELSEQFFSKKYIPCSLDAFEATFWVRFKKEVLDKAGENLIQVLFQCWCYFFDSVTWSVVQALILIQKSSGANKFKIKDLVSFICVHQEDDKRFQWVQKYKDSKSLETILRNSIVELKEFAFRIDDIVVHPLTSTKEKNILEIELHLERIFTHLVEKFNVIPARTSLTKIIEILLAYRSE